MTLIAIVVMLIVGWFTLLAVHRAASVGADPVLVLPLASGKVPLQHALSRYHVRWYVASVVFLAFDVEMLFMYPWAVALPGLGAGAVLEMFGFLAVVLAAVAWARREGAFRWE